MIYERMLASFFSGVVLSISGSLIQIVTQNELAGPSTLGLNAVVVFIILIGYLSSSLAFMAGIPIEWKSFLLLFIVLMMAYLWSRKEKTEFTYGNAENSKMNFYILVGLCLNLLIGAFFSILQFIFLTLNKEFPDQLWYGHFRYTKYEDLLLFIPVSAFIYVMAAKFSRHLYVISFGSGLAQSLGVNVNRVFKSSILLSFLGIGVIGCFFGVFSFMGLIFPHILRSFEFFRVNVKRELMVGSLVCGLIFMTLDYLCFEVLFWGAEMPVGMISSAIGTIFLLFLLVHKALKKKNSFVD